MKIIKIICVTVSVLLLATALGVTAGAMSVDAYGSAEFVINDDATVVSRGERSWQRVKLPAAYSFAPLYSYRFKCGVEGDSKEPSLLHIWDLDFAGPYDEHLEHIYDGRVIFADEEAEKELRRFFSGGEASRIFIGKYIYSMKEAPEALCASLRGAAADEKFDGGMLESCSVWYLYEYDATGTVVRTAGAIFKDAERVLFVDYGKLGNPYFYADGTLALDAGTEIPGAVLDENMAKTLDDYLLDSPGQYDSEYPLYEYEGGTLGYGVDSSISKILFWAAFIFAGLIVPAGIMIAGVLLSTRNRPGAQRWRVLIWLSALWLVTAAAAAALILCGA